ncbi:acylneuraminate cytidylyltransferase family protein [Flavobacterium xinjiangense]|uniref:N-acylneuraminate cytidylyltransferase/CMP-N,N'-diacetyllegionaminic acid synthase n=1 Tax=Flavobacterium xinjiangense TaxID=178356 RepID=A0A1M7MXW4_9FLAO|nr:acylneuraminate cytidylyltransferase family protein [Flavobacterium xinjiangense]SHM95515.1 N-acylneuraminate cytidylyltransferase/CMP-N,N'-diacetyllegionaminic acid synthase [Flavobacterium xinjiangense]
MRILVVIPARGGSKGVPKKNIKLLGGKPLIAHAIECANSSKLVSKIVVSTDSDEIAAMVSNYKIEVVKRPLELADDTSNVVTAVEHAYKFLNEEFDIIVLLQPTSPLRTPKDLDDIIRLLQENPQTDGVISVVPMNEIHPARMYNLADNSMLTSFLENGETLRRQDLNPVYYRNGCFYAVRTKAFFEQKSFMVENKLAFIMNPDWLANIDTQRDFKLATLLYQDWKNENTNH